MSSRITRARIVLHHLARMLARTHFPTLLPYTPLALMQLLLASTLYAPRYLGSKLGSELLGVMSRYVELRGHD